MAIQNDYIERFEFFTIYPNKEGGNTLIATLLTRDGYRALMYAPSVSPIDAEINTGTYVEEIRDIRNVPLLRLETAREFKYNGSIYCLQDKHNARENWYCKVIYLDGPMSKTIVKKEEVEKLFGCAING